MLYCLHALFGGMTVCKAYILCDILEVWVNSESRFAREYGPDEFLQVFDGLTIMD